MGPLAGIKVVEIAGIGPAPMAAMLLADLGATVLRVDRIEPAELGIQRPAEFDLVLRSRKAIALDLKQPGHAALALELIGEADALIEGFRPGAMERLGLGPEVCLQRNPRLVYGRMTGWGQSGPLASAAGHDINYIAVTGALAAIGRHGQPPTPPLNLVGDYGGGSLYLALGLLAALIEAKRSGQGQVVDAAIVDGTASLMTAWYGLHAAGIVQPERGSNLIDGGAWFYDVFECADAKWVSIGPIEGRFRQRLLELMEIDPARIGATSDRDSWPLSRRVLAERFLQKTRDEWCALLEGSDACFAPVLDCDEAPRHPHLQARGTFISVDGVVQPAPAPRFSRSTLAMPTAGEPATAAGMRGALQGWVAPERIEAFVAAAGRRSNTGS
ncbi:MAG TPA: CaiB/BaiF CoA-transferase family protein [Albitalea sp.]|nr:CaiB/BaiF CoA-transferase family protein [Albitalea sp.]